MADGFGFLEGPVWVHSSAPGYLIFSDIPANAIDKWNPADGKVSVFLAKSGFAGADPGDAGYQLNNGHAVVTLYGSNGITLDKQGRVTYCQHGDRGVMRLEKDGKRTVLADRYEGKRLNSPNDLVYKSDGSLYFTDPPYGLRKLADDPKKELPFSGVYRLAKGKLEVVNKDFQAPNGLAFSPDEKYLYVNDSASKTYWRFDVQPDGTLANKKLLIDMSSSKEDGRARRNEDRSKGKYLRRGSRRHLGFDAGRETSRHDPASRKSRQSGLGRRRREDAILHGRHRTVPASGEHSRHSAVSCGRSALYIVIPSEARNLSCLAAESNRDSMLRSE